MESTGLHWSPYGLWGGQQSIVTVSESEDSVIFVLTRANSCCTEQSDNNEKDTILFSDEDMADLVKDEEEDGLTTFEAAMLVNIEGNVEGIQTKLYDSGASRLIETTSRIMFQLLQSLLQPLKNTTFKP